ncbi:hypothetical protein ACS8FA_13750, partial [Psychrobacter sp. 1Y1]
VAVIASLFDAIRYIDKPLLLYRQHGMNVVGAPTSKYKKFKCRYKWANLEAKVTPLLNIANITNGSASKLDLLLDLSLSPSYIRFIKTPYLIKDLHLENSNCRELRFAIFNK